MGRVGSALDNAACESFHSTLKVEYVYRRTFATKAEAIRDITGWITGKRLRAIRARPRRLLGSAGTGNPP